MPIYIDFLFDWQWYCHWSTDMTDIELLEDWYRLICLGFPAPSISQTSLERAGWKTAGPYDVSWLQGGHWVERGQGGLRRSWQQWQRQNKEGGCKGARHFFGCEYILFGLTLGNVCHTHKCYHLLSAGCERSCDFRWKVAQASATMRSKWSLKIWVVWRGERTEEWSLRTQDGVRDKGQQQGLSHKVVVVV